MKKIIATANAPKAIGPYSQAVAVSPTWAPGEAYLAARKRAKAERAAARTRTKTGLHE